MGEARPVKDVTADIAARTLKTIFDVVHEWKHSMGKDIQFHKERGSSWDVGFVEGAKHSERLLIAMLHNRGIEVPHE